MKREVICIFALMACVTMSCSVDDDDNSNGYYSGEDISGQASILRNNGTKEAVLDIDATGNWSLYSGPSVESIDIRSLVLTGTTAGEFPLDVSTTERSYFKLVTNKGTAILAERRLPIDSCYHFRDMGGYKTTDGRFVKWGKVFRTDEYHKINEADLAYLNSLPLRTIADFRSESEASGKANLQPESVTSVHDLNISIGNLTEVITNIIMSGDIKTITEAEVEEVMCDTYRQFVTDEGCLGLFKTLFELLQDNSKTPLAYNCSVGKDRTGIISYLFLTSLGVSKEVAFKDYELTNEYGVKEKYASVTGAYPALVPLFDARGKYLQAAIDQIEADHGSVETFLTDVLDIDLAKMKSLYLY